MNNRIKNFFSIIGLVFSSLVLFTFLIHLFYHNFFYHSSKAFKDYTHKKIYQPFPYIGFKATSGINGVNHLGYPGKAPEKKAKDEYRIFVLGGSTVFGFENSFPSILEQQLHHQNKSHVKVYNFGAISSNSGQELSRVVHELVDLKPDLIIMYNGANDLMHPLYSDPRPNYPFNFMLIENHPLFQSSIQEYPLLDLSLYSSGILRKLFSQYFFSRFTKQDELREKNAYLSKEWEKEITDSYLRNIETTQKLLRGFNISFLAFFQPQLAYKEKLIGTEKKKFPESSIQYLKDQRERIQKEISESPDFKLIDLSDLFSNIEKEVYLDSVHIKPEFEILIAKKILSYIDFK